MLYSTTLKLILQTVNKRKSKQHPRLEFSKRKAILRSIHDALQKDREENPNNTDEDQLNVKAETIKLLSRHHNISQQIIRDLYRNDQRKKASISNVDVA